MTTMPIRQYAEKHGLSADGLAEMLETVMECEVDVEGDAQITALDDVRESIYEMAIDELVSDRDNLDAAREEVRAMENVLRDSVRRALLDGLPATRIAQVLGVSRARVYQIRDGKR